MTNSTRNLQKALTRLLKAYTITNVERAREKFQINQVGVKNKKNKNRKKSSRQQEEQWIK